MRRILYTLAIVTLAVPITNAQEYDDIYYNPKKDNASATTKKKSNYIKDFASMDVDTYNRRGQYYTSPIDTIGANAESDEDFVYTQQIQKFYNPTIVVDNSALLQDVLSNSYGNVEIVYNDYGYPTFASVYSWPYYGGYYGYYGWNDPWYWDYWGWRGPSWRPSWYWGSAWNWWGPSWSWGHSWAWGPSWGWGATWRPTWGIGHGHYADYRPAGRTPNRPGTSWAANTRPGGNMALGNGGKANGARVPSYNNSGNTSQHRGYQTGVSNVSGNRTNNNINQGAKSNNNSGKSYTINNSGHRTYNSNNSSVNNNSNVTTNRSQNNNNRSQSNFNNNNYTNKNNTNSYNNNRNYNSGGRSTGGFGNGGNTGGGGGSRGRHR